MDINEIIKVEIEPICITILEYATDTYIVSYAKQLKCIDFSNEKSKFFMLVERLFDWYNNEMTVILNSEYCLSIDNHRKSQKILSILLSKKDEVLMKN